MQAANEEEGLKEEHKEEADQTHQQDHLINGADAQQQELNAQQYEQQLQFQQQ